MAQTLHDILTTQDVESRLERIRVLRGEVLIEQGSPSRELYLVSAGRFRVELNGTHLGDLDSGSVIGEIAFFTNVPRTATVIASRDSLVFRLTREEYGALCAEIPSLRDAVTAQLSRRIAESHRFLSDRRRATPPPKALAIIGAGGQPLPGEIIMQIAAALEIDRPVRVVTNATYRAEMGRTPSGSPNAIAWFCSTERQDGLTLYLPEATNNDWNMAIIRHSDEVLFVGTAGAPPHLSPLENFAFDQIPRENRRLLLLHPRRHPHVSGTAGWLRTYQVGMHHHATLEDTSDIERLGRFVNGTAVGLVCSGGGAFGPAHSGVRSALAKAGARFDIFGGTSAGAALTAAFALGMSSARIANSIDDIFVRHNALRRATIPVYALVDHATLDNLLRAHFTEADIEDLWYPFFAVATNLTTNATEVIRSGPVWAAIRASSAIPGVLPPFLRDDGAILVDGGMLDNLPLDTMRELKNGPNVVSSLERWQERRADLPYAELPSRWQILRDLLNPFADRRPWAPGITETLVRSMMASQFSRKPPIGQDDILLRPPMLPNMDLLSWRNHRAVAREAECYAEEVIARADPAQRPVWNRVIPGLRSAES